jgi:hypothetical protein
MARNQSTFKAGCYVPDLLLLLPWAVVSGNEDIEGQDGRIGSVSLALGGKKRVRRDVRERAGELRRRVDQNQRWPCLPRPARDGSEARAGEQTREKSEWGCLEESQTHRRHEVAANTQEAKECKKKNKEWSGGLLVNQGCEEAAETVCLSPTSNPRTERSSALVETGEQPFDRRVGKQGSASCLQGPRVISAARDKAPGGKFESGALHVGTEKPG